MKVGITGMGIISAIGNNVNENLQALLEAKSGISTIEHISTLHKDAIKVGEIKYSNEELIELLNLNPESNYTRTSLLGIWAAREAVAQAGIKIDSRTGFISATSVGGMDRSENYFFDYEALPEKQKYILSHDAGDVSFKIANDLGVSDFVTTISTACSSGANAIMLGARMILAGELDTVIVGGTDALSKFTINGFKSLMILSDTENTPFDQNRKGLNLGEGAAYLVLESAKRTLDKNVLGYVEGWGNANDAYHQTASSETGEGAALAMKKAIQGAGISPREIDYVNAHGTATVNNDLSEGRALLEVFSQQVPSFSSTKPFTGHTLAAAGAIEAVYSLLALREKVQFPNLNFSSPMEEFSLLPLTQLRKFANRYVLSNSFGFGGNCSSLIFSSVYA